VDEQHNTHNTLTLGSWNLELGLLSSSVVFALAL